MKRGAKQMKKDDIIQSAIEEFGRNDYDRASINSIIEKSNTSKGTFYHYFSSKEELYLELLTIVAKEKIKFLQGKANEVKRITSDSSIFEILRAQVEASVKFGLTYPKYVMFSARVANETNQDIRKKIETIVGSTTNEYLNPLIKTNIEQKMLRSDIPEEFISQLLVYMLTHFNDFILNMGVNIDLKYTHKIMEYLKYYVDFVEKGLSNTK